MLGTRPYPPGTAAGLDLVAVFGKDERRALKQSESGFKGQIGLLFNNTARTVCTAFCVAPRLIATAGHCLFRPSSKGKMPDLAGFWFTNEPGGRKAYSRLAGYGNGTSLQNVMVDTTDIKVRPPIDAAGDWAVIRLARAACEGQTLPLSTATSAEIERQAQAGKVFQVAFHRDFEEWQLARSGTCEVRREFEGLGREAIERDFHHADELVLHRCDTGEASSGSPILLETETGPVVVAINVGTYVQSKVLMQNGTVRQRFAPETIANTGVSARHLKPLVDAMQRARIATSERDILEFQKRLRALGFYAGALDGHFGELTRAAIRAYQQSMTLAVTGLPTDELAQHLVGVPPLPERKAIDQSSWVVPSGG
ncbi:MAG: peptidoglycan-binding domain-containing protein [Hyphomicrobiaceae bacterium]